jgi:hypothetical protein
VSHPQVPHPLETLPPRSLSRLGKRNDTFLTWLATHILASMVMFDLALVLPLLTIPASNGVKITLGVISGSWIQWWALPALQRMQIKADAKRDAKADADHQAQTHIAVTGDEVLRMVSAIHALHVDGRIPDA